MFNAGDNALLARSLHDEIKKLTDQPVKYVVLENAQGHAALGASYWKDLGVPIIAHKDTAHQLKEHGLETLERMQQRLRDKSYGTRLVMPDKVFDGQNGS